MKCVGFRYQGRFAHFLRAEANASAPSYPIPPRTTLLGLMGAVLGLKKDAVQNHFGDAPVAVAGSAESTHWHYTNFRNDVHPPLPWCVRASAKADGKHSDSPKQVRQEWLINPNFEVWTILPYPFDEYLAQRLEEYRWYFNPYLGISEMGANLELISVSDAIRLPPGSHEVTTVMRHSEVNLESEDLQRACDKGVGLQSLRMPREVSAHRRFTHENYLRELGSKPFPVHTQNAWQINEKVVMWL